MWAIWLQVLTWLDINNSYQYLLPLSQTLDRPLHQHLEQPSGLLASRLKRPAEHLSQRGPVTPGYQKGSNQRALIQKTLVCKDDYEE